uniref:F-box domain-containing protein n=1 Tax=Parascaris univalens TaxID=6257 RepID=A0A915AS17_PARUN
MVVRSDLSSNLPTMYEITSPGSETSPTAESFYGFANRLHPITAGGVQPPQFVMPQSYPQARSGYMAGAMARPNSAAAKRGGRRPKEYEEYDHVALSEEERDKRDKRRLRNKEAAARCRQRRLDLMGSLQNQVDQLKEDNKVKDSKIAELQLLKNELLAVVREHQCVLPESLRQSLDVDMSSTQQYMPRGGTNIMLPTEVAPFTHTEQSSAQTLLGRKRPASELIPELRQPPQPTSMPNNSSTLSLTSTAQTNILPRIHVKQEPTLYDVNGRDTQEEEMKRPTSLSFSEGVAATTASYGALSSSGVPITTPSNLLGAVSSGHFSKNLSNVAFDGVNGIDLLGCFYAKPRCLLTVGHN